MTGTNNLNKFVLEAGPEDCAVRCRITRNCRGLDKGEWCLVTNYEIHQIYRYIMTSRMSAVLTTVFSGDGEIEPDVFIFSCE